MSNIYNQYNEIFDNGTSTLITSYDWHVNFFKAPPVMSGDTNASGAPDKVLNKSFALRTINWQAPDIPGNAMVTANIRGHQISQPGISAWNGQVVFTAQDFADLALTKYFTLLSIAQDDPKNHSTNGRSPNTFRFGFDIYRCNPQGYYIQRWHCDPCILTDVNIQPQGTSSKQNAGQVTVVFMVDLFTIQFPKDNMPTQSTLESNWTDYTSSGK